MVLIADSPRGTESVYRSKSIPASLNDNFDDFSVAVTVKQSNVTIEARNTFDKRPPFHCCVAYEIIVLLKTKPMTHLHQPIPIKHCSL
jgi:hypothetical protein